MGENQRLEKGTLHNNPSMGHSSFWLLLNKGKPSMFISKSIQETLSLITLKIFFNPTSKPM